MKRLPLWLGALSLLAASPAGAAELDSGDLHLELSGSLRSLFTHTRRIDAEGLLVDGSTRRRDSGLLLERARVSLEGTYGDRFSGRLTYDNEFVTGSAIDSLSFQLSKEFSPPTWFNWDRVISDHSDGWWQHLIYRAWVRYEGDAVEVTLGRQRIALGRGRIWTPTDLFNPIPALAIEQNERIGQDSAVVRVRLHPDLWAVGIWSPQDDPDQHRAVGRLELSTIELDAAVMAGRIAKDWVFGGDFALNVAGAAVRGEATFADVASGGHIWQVVGSADYTFGVGSGLYALVEHSYNEDLVESAVFAGGITGLAGILDRLKQQGIAALSRVPSRVRHTTAFMTSYELTPLLSASVLWLHDWNGPSEALVPSLAYSPRSDLEISVGAQLFIGSDKDSAYVDVPGIFYVQVDWFF